MPTLAIKTKDQQTYDKVKWVLERIKGIEIETEKRDQEEKEFVRTPGHSRGHVKMHDDFDAPLPDDVMKGFGG